MVDYLTTEEQQAEAIKKWLRENGMALLLGAVLGLAAVFGWRTWTAYQRAQAEGASGLYAQMMVSLEQGESAQARQAAQRILDEYTSTGYAFFSALALAGLAVEDGDLETARGRLEWALENAPDQALAYITRVRLARVLLAQGQPGQARAILDTPAPTGMEGLQGEVRGDVAAAMGDNKLARESYAAALAGSAAPADRERIQMKLDELPEV